MDDFDDYEDWNAIYGYSDAELRAMADEAADLADAEARFEMGMYDDVLS